MRLLFYKEKTMSHVDDVSGREQKEKRQHINIEKGEADDERIRNYAKKR